MSYQFTTNEQAKQDWENGRVQIEHLQNGRSVKLNRLLGTDVEGNFCYYIKLTDRHIYNCSNDFKIFNTPIVPTDELYDMVFGEGEYKPHGKAWEDDLPDVERVDKNLFKGSPQPKKEIIGYELNGVRASEQIAEFINGYPALFRRLITDKKIIQNLSDLGILSTCFNPIYKEKEVKVNLFTGHTVTVTKEYVNFYGLRIPLSITDIQLILDAHKTL